MFLTEITKGDNKGGGDNFSNGGIKMKPFYK